MRDVVHQTWHSPSQISTFERYYALRTHYRNTSNGRVRVYAGRYYAWVDGYLTEVPSDSSGHFVLTNGSTNVTYLSKASARAEASNSDGFSPTGYSAYRLEQSLEPSSLSPSGGWWRYHYHYKWETQRRLYSSGPPALSGLDDGTLFGFGNNFTQAVPHNLYEVAALALLEKVADRRASLAVSLAESVENYNTIVELFIKALRLYRAIRRGNLREIKRLLKELGLEGVLDDVADTWLAYQLGLSPIIREIQNLLEIFENGLKDRQNLIKVEVNKEDLQSESYLNNGSLVHREHRFNVRMGVTFGVLDANLDRLRQLGLDNPIEVGWELIPYSFVYDWFVNVGSMLAGFSATAGVGFMHGYVTRYHESMWTCGGSTGDGSAFDRKVLSDFPRPSLSFGSGIFPGSRLATASALLWKGR